MLLCNLFSVEMCSCRQVTWGQTTIQVWGYDDSPSLHEFGRRSGSKQVKCEEEKKWGRKTKELGKIAKCEEKWLIEKSWENGSKSV